MAAIAWMDLIAGRGDRFTLDYVLIEPTDKFLGDGAFFPRKQLTAVLGSRPGVNVEKLERLTKQVVRFHIIMDRSIRLGSAIPEFVVVSASDFAAGDSTNLTLMITIVQRTGAGSTTDIDLAEEKDAEAFRDPKIVEVSQGITQAVGTVGRGAPGVALVGLGVAAFLVARKALT